MTTKQETKKENWVNWDSVIDGAVTCASLVAQGALAALGAAVMGRALNPSAVKVTPISPLKKVV